MLHCCVHLARNNQSNTGVQSDLLKRFWTMRYNRTEESEHSFVDSLQSLHAAKRSQFTTKLLASLDTFVPSKFNHALDIDIFPEIDALRNADWSSVVIDTPVKERVFNILNQMMHIGPFRRDVFSLDNTNTIEGYFNTIKKRVPLKTATLLDNQKAVTFTGECALSSNHPNSQILTATLVDCLSSFVSMEVLSVMSATGIRSFLTCLVE